MPINTKINQQSFSRLQTVFSGLHAFKKEKFPRILFRTPQSSPPPSHMVHPQAYCIINQYLESRLTRKLFHYFPQPGILYVATEYARYGNLLNFLRSSRTIEADSPFPSSPTSRFKVNVTTSLTAEQILGFAADVALGMQHLAQKGVRYALGSSAEGTGSGVWETVSIIYIHIKRLLVVLFPTLPNVSNGTTAQIQDLISRVNDMLYKQIYIYIYIS